MCRERGQADADVDEFAPFLKFPQVLPLCLVAMGI